MTVNTFRKKPVEIEAMHVAAINTKTARAATAWCPNTFIRPNANGGNLVVSTLEGDMTVSPGDWIIKGVAGEFYSCKPDIFKQTYEAVADD